VDLHVILRRQSSPAGATESSRLIYRRGTGVHGPFMQDVPKGRLNTKTLAAFSVVPLGLVGDLE
jgi:hypothetical protein